MSENNILVDRDINTASIQQPAVTGAQVPEGKEIKSMEYHRQMLQNKVDDGQ